MHGCIIHQSFAGEGAGEEPPEFGDWQKPRRTLVSSDVKPREVSIAGQQSMVMTSTAWQQPTPSLVSPLRKKRTISLVHDFSSYSASQHSISPPPLSLAAMFAESAVAGSLLPEILTRRRRVTVAKRKLLLEAIVLFAVLLCCDGFGLCEFCFYSVALDGFEG